MTERYLGDGLYASFDGYQIWLRAPRVDGEHRIALEPPVFAVLLAFADETGVGLVIQRDTSLDKPYAHALSAALVARDICPRCGGPLDTGWECLRCGYDAIHLHVEG